ncbi:NfeD family protein [Pseudonocardia sichuanensis]|uniref:Membrane protein implicated in regulation of membrane protease activity n=1 Tax=Pseudonocardia kunmingensis TaxID=630975 RepID=A0A543D3M2_9PSEU|nr:NfeD family protein [Pseudonocardia kunmingensis]TQM03946.1 membrane protein implicated in regulation of membrane protease activity [Pseudonocardia kunmingensis]
MTAAVIWLILGVVLVVAEVLSGEFVLLMLGGGALAAGGVSLIVGGPVVGGIVFAVVSVLLLLAVRPALRKRLDRGVDPAVMHHEALLGSTAVVVARVDGHGGRVKIGGDLWSARTSEGHEPIEPGARVTVLTISGATAVVVAQD